ncbi:hypothetical protein N072000002_18120 [Clostridium tetani]|uniref:Uncharacterized protein n=1 Tax=Clostridium tetani TaxID=1513 RepID=A0ABC8EDA6_CLOTA|nr:hypothetical protein [Clostridium tetani]BDR81629.1 hypothetical protein K234311028_18750 [Clostridium tetani]BDR90011.1 hypothetical protein N072000002_18120 [Clostridium tetani]
MSKFKENNFFKTVLSFLKTEEGTVEQVEMNKNFKAPSRIWKKECNPLRSVVLWGYDKNNNPSFLILYGKHEFESTQSDGESIVNVLKDSVKYDSYAVFSGREGHLPSFQAVKIIEEGGYHDKKEEFPKMYYKTGLKYDWYWRRDENYLVKEFKKLDEEKKITLPYFKEMLYEECIEKIEAKNIDFDGFRLVKHPNDILKINEENSNYCSIICNIISNKNLYMRKKLLNELLESNPPKEIFDLILKVGSTELISGLFLEFAKKKNLLLIEEAKTIIKADINWGSKSYTKGVKRCADIYVNALTKELRDKREVWIREHLEDMDLHLISLNGKKFPKDKIIEGAQYRKYAAQELLREYCGSYENKNGNWKWVTSRVKERYKISTYSDGVVLNINELKNTLEEAEAYGLADVIGKIAYYLDAPRLTYYFKGNGKGKVLKYFKRYIKRIIASYAKNDEDKFMEAMKSLLTSYTKYDYVCKFKGNFQFNDFIKYYLYYDFTEKPPIGWENRYSRHQWMESDQLMKLEGRYEFMKEIWDNHLEDVLDIASNANIDTVFKACYYILKDSEKTNELIDKMNYKKLSKLTQVSYKPLADMFMTILKDKLDKINAFDSKLMFELINNESEKIHELALDFFEKTNGSFKAEDLVEFMLLDNLDKWTSFFEKNVLSLKKNEYLEFVKSIIDNSEKFEGDNIDLSKEIKDILSSSTSKVENLSEGEKIDLIDYVVSTIFDKAKMSNWMETYLEELIFSLSYEDLNNLIKKTNIEFVQKAVSVKNRKVICILEAIKYKKIPLDSEFISILETGTSQMIKILFEIMIENSEELKKRFSTLLIMLESDVTMLNKNAEEIFDKMDKEDQKKLHRIIIDSPVSKVYLFGLRKLDEIYKDLIPKEFIIQMLEHTAHEVKTYISYKTQEILDNLGNGDEELFTYYVKTLLYLPNKVSKNKDKIYESIPKFVFKYRNKLEEFEDMLLDIGGSNIIIDSERALITLAKIRREAVSFEG